MNPKDMAVKDLLRASKGSYSCKEQHAGINLCDWINNQEAIESELLRRLVERDQYKSKWENCNSDFHFAVTEADALRKENEELKASLGRVGTRVRKIKGYPFEGEIRADFTTTAGLHRIVVDNGYGMLHIFNNEQMEVVSKESEASHE